MQYHFRVEGKLTGYTVVTARTKWSDRAKAYYAYKEKVQWLARKAGVPLPVVSSDGEPVQLDTAPFTVRPRTRRHPDCDNIWKGVADALSYHGHDLGKQRGFGRDSHFYGTIGLVKHLPDMPGIRADWVDVTIEIENGKESE